MREDWGGGCDFIQYGNYAYVLTWNINKAFLEKKLNIWLKCLVNNWWRQHRPDCVINYSIYSIWVRRHIKNMCFFYHKRMIWAVNNTNFIQILTYT